MYVVFGANGRAGGATARALLETGAALRVVLRDAARQGAAWQARGAEVAQASLDDADAVAAALDGAEAAFLLNPPPVSGDPWARTEAIGTALAAGVRRAGLPRAVILSSIGAQHGSGTGIVGTLHRIEALLDGVAPATAFLRPGYFIESWGEVAPAARAEGVLPCFFDPALKIPMVSTEDVGRAAAALLTERWQGRRVVELDGPHPLSATDIATAFARHLGRPVAPLLIPAAERLGALTGAGVTPKIATELLGLYDGLATGHVVSATDSEHRRGTEPLDRTIARLLGEARAAA